VRSIRPIDHAGHELPGWLFRIMRNVFLNELRSEHETPDDGRHGFTRA
jgi:DNA-directed RNA polymerase specialized sigma24 family protein